MTSLTCPQCGGSLPRAAKWRMVPCPYCKAMVTRSNLVVEAAEFHRAWLRCRPEVEVGWQVMRMGEQLFRILAELGGGHSSEVFLADRLNALPERVVIRRAKTGPHPDTSLPGNPDQSLSAEYANLRLLQALSGPGSAYFSQRLPQAIALGQCLHTGHALLISRAIPGCWGSLWDVLRFNPNGIDMRHGVWIWRRILDTLSYVHQQGWSHGDLHLDHVLLQPADHGAFLIGWSQAQCKASINDQANDLMRSAWCIRALLHGTQGDTLGVGVRTPAVLADLLVQASENQDWCANMGATKLDQALKAAAREAYGPPQFHHFDPRRASLTSV